MTRGQRPKRSPTPTSATFPPEVLAPPRPSPPSPISSEAKPLYLCRPFVEAALVKGNFKTIVMLPKYVDIMEWVAVNSAPHHIFPWIFLAHSTFSIRLLYESQRVLWRHCGILYSTKLSNDVSRHDVRPSIFLEIPLKVSSTD